MVSRHHHSCLKEDILLIFICRSPSCSGTVRFSIQVSSICRIYSVQSLNTTISDTSGRLTAALNLHLVSLPNMVFRLLSRLAVLFCSCAIYSEANSKHRAITPLLTLGTYCTKLNRRIFTDFRRISLLRLLQGTVRDIVE